MAACIEGISMDDMRNDMRKLKEKGVLYQSISLSPQVREVPLGFGAPTSNLDELIASSNSELPDLVDQAEFERILRRQMNLTNPFRP